MHEFPVIKARNPLLLLVKTVGIVNLLNTRQSVFTVFPHFSDFF